MSDVTHSADLAPSDQPATSLGSPAADPATSAQEGDGSDNRGEDIVAMRRRLTEQGTELSQYKQLADTIAAHPDLFEAVQRAASGQDPGIAVSAASEVPGLADLLQQEGLDPSVASAFAGAVDKTLEARLAQQRSEIYGTLGPQLKQATATTGQIALERGAAGAGLTPEQIGNGFASFVRDLGNKEPWFRAIQQTDPAKAGEVAARLYTPAPSQGAGVSSELHRAASLESSGRRGGGGGGDQRTVKIDPHDPNRHRVIMEALKNGLQITT